MVTLDDAVILRLKTHGENYEVYVDADKALEYKSGQDVPLDDILAADHVFKDAKKGDKASEEHLIELFKVEDMQSVLKEILRKGELHLTTEQRRRMHEERRRQIGAIIARNAVNPQTQTPHPLDRVLAAMDEARCEVNINRSANEQVEKAVKLLQPILPIKFEKVELAVKIPAEYAGKMYQTIRDYGEVVKEDWVGGEQYVLIRMPAGMQDEFYSKLNSVTHGSVKTKVVKHD